MSLFQIMVEALKEKEPRKNFLVFVFSVIAALIIPRIVTGGVLMLLTIALMVVSLDAAQKYAVYCLRIKEQQESSRK